MGGITMKNPNHPSAGTENIKKSKNQANHP